MKNLQIIKFCTFLINLKSPHFHSESVGSASLKLRIKRQEVMIFKWFTMITVKILLNRTFPKTVEIDSNRKIFLVPWNQFEHKIPATSACHIAWKSTFILKREWQEISISAVKLDLLLVATMLRKVLSNVLTLGHSLKESFQNLLQV